MRTLFFIPLFLIAVGAGRKAMKALGIFSSGHLEGWVFSAALGLGFLGYSVLITGLFHFLYAGVWWWLTVLGLAVFRSEIGDFVRELEAGIRSQSNVGFWFFILMAASIGVLTALPPTGGDPLCYHLGLPKVFVNQHAVSFLPYTANSLFPFLTEMLYALGLLLGGPTLAHLFHWTLGVLGALGTVVLASRFVSPKLSWLAAIVFLSTPGIFHQMPTATNDVAMAVFVLMGFVSLANALEHNENSWFLLSGIFWGFALSVKLISAIYAAAAGIGWIGVAWMEKKSMRTQIFSMGIWAVALLLFSGIWYLRSYWYLGNPVYPYFEWKGEGLDVGYNVGKHGVGKSLWNLLLLPWNLTMSPGSFGGRGNQIGPLFLAFLPGLVCISLKKKKHFLHVVFYTLLGAILWFWGPQNQRFLFPLVPFFVVLLVKVVDQWEVIAWSRNPLRLFLSFVFGGTLLLQIGSLARYEIKLLPAAFGKDARQNFLHQTERSYNPSELVNGRTQPGDRVLSEEIRVFYFQPQIVREDMFRRQTHYLKKFDQPEARLRFLKEKGFTHLLTMDVSSAASLPKIFSDWGFRQIPNDTFKFLGETKSTADGKAIRYRLYQFL